MESTTEKAQQEQNRNEAEARVQLDVLEKAGTESGNGIYNLTGVFVGRVGLMESPASHGKIVTHDPPTDLHGLGKLRWIVAHEIAFNGWTIIELYIGIIGTVWGAFLLLPYNTFDASGKLWLPVRTLFGATRGTPWFNEGAEVFVGCTLFTFHMMHLYAVCHGRRGDSMRGLTICVLLSLWSSIAVLFFAADKSVQNYATACVTIFFLFNALVKVFRTAGVR